MASKFGAISRLVVEDNWPLLRRTSTICTYNIWHSHDSCYTQVPAATKYFPAVTEHFPVEIFTDGDVGVKVVEMNCEQEFLENGPILEMFVHEYY